MNSMPDDLDFEKAMSDAGLVQVIDNALDSLSLYVNAADIDAAGFSRTHIVEGLIESNRVYEWLGKWKEGKTIAAIDMAAHTCIGRTWGDRRTVKALVIYVAGEAVDEIKMRIAAWRIFHDVQDPMPFYVRTRPVYLTDEIFSQSLANEVEALKARHPGLPVLLFIDTVARNFGPGMGENSGEGMGAFINNLIDIVATPNEATVIAVHHSGHSDNGRGRGHSSFEAAVDGAIKISMDKGGDSPVINVETILSRSTEGGDSLSFKVLSHELPGTDNFGNQITAPVIEYIGDYQPPKKQHGLGKKQAALLDLLNTLYDEHQERIDKGNLNTIARVSKAELHDEAAKREVVTDRSNFYKTVKGLITRSLITEDHNGFLYLGAMALT